MARKSTIKLLLINESDNESERLISLFRNAGRVARAFRPFSAEELHAMLEKESWDLVIANDRHPEIGIIQCLEQLQKMTPNLPSIVIRDSDAEAAFEAGASDVINSSDDQHLIFAAFRELRNHEQTKQLAQTIEKLADAEERCNLLMSQSDDAVAYLADGMLISCNPLFCSRFGYTEPDDLDCAPIIDLIDSADHNKFKNLLKKQLESGDSDSDFKFTGLKHDQETFAATMQLSNAVFDDEPCIQLTISEQANGSNAQSVNISVDRDPATGLYSHDFFIAQLKDELISVESESTTSMLIYIGVDNFTTFRSRYGITHAYNILLNIANFIQAQSADDNCLAHFCDDGFTMLMQKTDSNAAIQYAETLCKTLEKHIIEIDGQSIQCTASIGLLAIDSTLQNPEPNTLIDLAFNACESVREASEDHQGNGVTLYTPPKEKKTLGNAAGDEELDSFLAEALEEEQFSLTFQPVVSLRGSSGDHYEVRTTMQNEEGEILAANEFLANISFKDVNTRLDRWILLEATKKLSQEIESGSNTLLLINLTANTLQDESLITWLSVALKAGGLPPEALVFQFSESTITDFLKPAKSFAESIKELGCKISITDFGQSDNPFKALKHVNADYAKISDEFTKELESGGDIQILKAMVNSINESDAQAIISRVENASALAQLWQIGVDYIQGSYLAAPQDTMNYEFTDIA